MRARLTKLGAALAAIAALAVGGSALASAGQKATPPQPPGAVQDQSTPDNAAEAKDGPADTDSVQQGDQSTPDSSAESQSESADSESASESASESGPSDGPGGYADSNANADTQQQGEH